MPLLTETEPDVGAMGLEPASSEIEVKAGTLGGALQTATPLAIGQTMTGAIDVDGELDWYAVNLTAGQSYLFTENGTGVSPLADPYLEILDSTGHILHYNDDGGPGLNSWLRFTPDVSGVFYLTADAYDGIGGYSITAAAVAPQNPLDVIDANFSAPSNTLSVYFAAGGETSSGETAERSFTLAEQAAALQAWSSLSAVANLTFVQAASAAAADVVLLLEPSDDFLGQTFIGGGGPTTIALNDESPYWTSTTLAAGGTAYTTLIHEMGHVLGLAHPQDDFGGSEVMEGVDEAFDSYGSALLNQGVFTMMSYNDGWPTGGGAPSSYTSGYEASPMALDIAVLQQKYGAVASHTGDDVYVLDSGAMANGFAAIWDTGGIDSIVASGSGSPALIDLRPATLLNSVGGGGYVSHQSNFRAGFTIAAGVTIENAAGGSGNDTLIGNEADNVLTGGAGNDSLTGNGGVDLLYGGAGDDTYTVDRPADLTFEDAAAGTDTVRASAGVYLFANVENLQLIAGAGSIFGVGNELANAITGNEGDNLLIGGLGNDSLAGSDGADSLFGEGGADNLFGDDGIDYLVGGDGDDGLNGGGKADALYGEAGNDILTGGGDFFSDILVGGDGVDQLHGDSGLGDYDLMDGGDGDDSYYVDTPDDLTFEAIGGGFDTVHANIHDAGYYLYANVESLVLEGATPFGVGNELNNVITTVGGGNQWLLGGAGDDTLDGGNGDDVLFGESGADTFLFWNLPGKDVIGDFHPGVDHIQMNATAYGSFEEMAPHMIEVNGTTAIDMKQGSLIVINGVSLSQLSASDFTFVGKTVYADLSASAEPEPTADFAPMPPRIASSLEPVSELGLIGLVPHAGLHFDF
jgi:serralysin